MAQQASILQARDEAVDNFGEKIKTTTVDAQGSGRWRRAIPDGSAFTKREKTLRNGVHFVKPYETPRPEDVGVSLRPGEAQASSGVNASAKDVACERMWLTLFHGLELLEPDLDKSYLPGPSNYLTVARLLSELIERHAAWD